MKKIWLTTEDRTTIMGLEHSDVERTKRQLSMTSRTVRAPVSRHDYGLVKRWRLIVRLS